MFYAWLGIVLAGILGGSYVVPAKTIRRLRWDQTWLIYCASGMVMLPVGLAIGVAPELGGVVLKEHPDTALVVALCGAGWGLGASLFGLAIPHLGFAIAFAIVAGVVTLLGSLGPLLVGVARVEQGQRLGLWIGLTLLIVAIAVSAFASILRDRPTGAAHESRPGLGSGAALGIFVAVAAGALSSLLNTGFAYGGVLIARAEEIGVPRSAASMAVWVPALGSGFCVNFAVIAWRVSRQPRGWIEFREAPLADWLKAASLGLIWFLSIVIYSLSTLALGNAGTVYGWAVNGGLAILVSAAWGLRSGDWKGASSAARRLALVSAGTFITAFGILAASGR